MARPKPAERRLLRRFGKDRRGVAAVEFALIAPIMVLLYCGMAELCQAVIAERKADHVASAIGDLVSQTNAVTTADLADIFSVGNTIMAPFPSATLQMRITSVTADNSGTPRVDWSHGSGSLTPFATGAAISIPVTMTAGESIVMSESAYQYSSVLQYLLPNVLNYNEAYYLRPRRSDSVTCSNC
jgi:Flp pilus assembly protein TadG